MAPYPCPNCKRLVHFEVRVCPACAFTLGYDPGSDGFLFLGDGATTWRGADGQPHDVVVCANNNEYEVCNWLVGTDDGTPFCRACRHNRTIPDLTVPSVPPRWRKIEEAKRRMFHTLIHLGLPIETKAEEINKIQGLAFDFLYDPAAEEQGQAQITTGHDGGVITLNLIEADDVQRERIRRDMGEPYRTLLGHFRHEVGHHYWSRLIETDPAELDAFRAVFGDETIDYAQALEAHYGPDGGKVWTDDYVSFYATAHPWEDFAETFAHYLHMVDTLATIGGFAMRMSPFPGPESHPEPIVDFDPYAASTEQLSTQMVPWSFALNATNRSMGQPDLYPFRLSPAITNKIDYVNRLVAKARGAPATGQPSAVAA
ncbi:putative zinc-binding metallopeptidase [Sphingomonadaceae bacterium G21617-S1]|nr:putative zinc-binding metallopeptidase [Sphingomonadaceae bacterium G21617-S1]